MIKDYVKTILEIVECEKREAELMLKLEELINNKKGDNKNEIDSCTSRTD